MQVCATFGSYSLLGEVDPIRPRETQGKRRFQDQPTRVWVAIGYVVGLLALSEYLTGQWWPPFGLTGLWFYAAFAALVLGEFLIEPFFTRPADAIANGIALLIAVASVSLNDAQVDPATAKAGRTVLFAYGLIIVGMALVAVVFKDSSGPRAGIAAAATDLVGRYGRSRWVFSVLLFAAGYAVFADEADKVAVLYLSWLAVTVLQPFEAIAVWIAARRARPRRGPIGRVERIEDPGILVARLPAGSTPSLGSKVLLGSGHLPGTVVDVTTSLETPVVRVAPISAAPFPVGTEVQVLDEKAEDPVVGHVGAGTNLDELSLDTPPAVADLGLSEGRLVAAPIGAMDALFQVTSAEVVTSRDVDLQRDLVHVTARKLGVWNEGATSFDPVPWIPRPGEPVKLLSRPGAPVFVAERIGHVPGTVYGISIDLDYAVTHNSAILGILGIGKTHLAWELIQRMLAAGIKVVALDITGRYSQHLSGICSPATENAIAEQIENQIASTVAETLVRGEEAGNIPEFRTSMAAVLQSFFDGDQRLLIINPNRFEVSRMEGRPYQQHANLLVRLTMVEVTRIISEQLLDIVQRADASADPQEEEDPRPEKAKLCLVLEEGHSLVPEWNSTASDYEQTAVNGTARALLQGRKYGYGCLLITQRTANVTKSILNQCNTIFGLRIYDATGMGFLENYIGPTHARLLASLKDRSAIVFGRASSCNAPLIIDLNDAAAFASGFWGPVSGSIPVTSGPEPPQPPSEPPNADSPFF